jgi:hypothetical protein
MQHGKIERFRDSCRSSLTGIGLATMVEFYGHSTSSGWFISSHGKRPTLTDFPPA